MTCPRCGGRHLMPCGPTVPVVFEIRHQDDKRPGGMELKFEMPSGEIVRFFNAHLVALGRKPVDADLMPLWLIDDIANGAIASVTTEDVQRLARTALFLAAQANPHDPSEQPMNMGA